MALVQQRDGVFLRRVADDYKLDYDELCKKYLETSELSIVIPKAYKKAVKEPKSVKVTGTKEPKAKAEKQCCTAQTSKKDPCKFSALKGEVFCKRHLKQSLGEASPSSKPVKKSVKKAEQPMHTHQLGQTDGACELCESHGNPLAGVDAEFEVAPAAGPVKVVTVEDRLRAMLQDADEDDGSEASDDDEEVVVEEEFEDDD